MKQSQSVRQRMTLQQRLSPQQIQYIKLLQLPTLLLEQRVKQEIEQNPVLELDDEIGLGDDETGSLDMEGADEDKEQDSFDDREPAGDAEETALPDNQDQAAEGVDDQAGIGENREIDWETYFHDDDQEYVPAYKSGQEDFRDIPKQYKSGFMEKVEQQIVLLDLDERLQKVATEIIGSVDSDGYLRRDLDSIIDAVAFSEGVLVTYGEAEEVLHQIQRLDPPGIAARNLRECLMVQLELMEPGRPARDIAIEILDKAWPYFKKKHYDKILRKLNISEDQLKEANSVIMNLDPKPGESDEYLNPEQFIVPDFEVYYEELLEETSDDAGEFVIKMHHRNMPGIRVSRHYKELWDSMGKGSSKAGDNETRQFIRDKMESARWFIESIQQRKHTLMSVMKTIVALQEDFFKTGKGIRPMILKDVAERIQMDISTVSRVVNGKYVQTPFGVYELKYFFNEGMETESGEAVSNREIKNILLELVSNEDKMNPLSDQALADAFSQKGYPIARRTISKYREQLNIPVARMRRGIG